MNGYLILYETKVKARKLAQGPENVLLHEGDMIETEDKDQGKVISSIRIYESSTDYLNFVKIAMKQETWIPRVISFWRMLEVEYNAAE